MDLNDLIHLIGLKQIQIEILTKELQHAKEVITQLNTISDPLKAVET